MCTNHLDGKTDCSQNSTSPVESPFQILKRKQTLPKLVYFSIWKSPNTEMEMRNGKFSLHFPINIPTAKQSKIMFSLVSVLKSILQLKFPGISLTETFLGKTIWNQNSFSQVSPHSWCWHPACRRPGDIF